MNPDQQLDAFVRQIRRRSHEHTEAIAHLAKAGLLSPSMSILRQEVDSLTRVIYLLSLPLAQRKVLIASSVAGERWRRPNGKGWVTDRDMVDFAQQLFGWTQSVYKFGCAFIHLSNLHDYDISDPLGKLSDVEKTDILEHLRYYHGGPTSDDPTIDDLLPILPKALEKISGNLECYLDQLENREVIDPGDIW